MALASFYGRESMHTGRFTRIGSCLFKQIWRLHCPYKRDSLPLTVVKVEHLLANTRANEAYEHFSLQFYTWSLGIMS